MISKPYLFFDLCAENAQIEGFLKNHGGPGLQHIGLCTSDMVGTVMELVKHGVQFRHPPPTYYTKVYENTSQL
jgi:4-hydroxymandelate synthase